MVDPLSLVYRFVAMQAVPEVASKSPHGCGTCIVVEATLHRQNKIVLSDAHSTPKVA